MSNQNQLDIQVIAGNALLYAYILALDKLPLAVGSGRYGYRSDHGSIVEPTLSRLEAADLIAERWISVERPSNGQRVPTFRCLTNYTGKRKPYEPIYVVTAHSSDLPEAVIRCFVASRFEEKLRMFPKDHLEILRGLMAAEQQAPGVSEAAAATVGQETDFPRQRG